MFWYGLTGSIAPGAMICGNPILPTVSMRSGSRVECMTQMEMNVRKTAIEFAEQLTEEDRSAGRQFHECDLFISLVVPAGNMRTHAETAEGLRARPIHASAIRKLAPWPNAPAASLGPDANSQLRGLVPARYLFPHGFEMNAEPSRLPYQVTH